MYARQLLTLLTLNPSTNLTKTINKITSLNKIHTKLDNVHNDLYKEKDGLWSRLETAEDNLESTVDSNEVMHFEMSIMIGVIQHQE